MAYAAITKQLIVDVQNRIAILANAEKAQVPSNDALVREISADTAFKEALINRLWEPEKDLRDRLDKYSNNGKLTAATTMIHEDELNGDGEPMRSTITINMGDIKVPVIAKQKNSYYDRFSVTVDVAMDAHPKLAEIAANIQALRQTSNRWDKVKDQVTKFLESCKSANEALKLWPDVSRYLPKAVLDKVALKTEKASAKESGAIEALKALDMDAINTSNVLARMAGARI